MIPKILVPVDSSATTRKTLENIITLKDRFSKELTLLHVLDFEHFAYQMLEEFQIDMIKENSNKAGTLLLDRAGDQLKRAGFVNNLRLEIGETKQVIADIANDEQFQLVVIGRHEGGGQIRDVLFGSVANHLLHNVKCPVLLF